KWTQPNPHPQKNPAQEDRPDAGDTGKSSGQSGRLPENASGACGRNRIPRPGRPGFYSEAGGKLWCREFDPGPPETPSGNRPHDFPQDSPRQTDGKIDSP